MSLVLEIFKIIFPTFFMIFIGYLSTRYNLMSKSFIDEGNKLVFNVFMPLYMFISIVNSSSLERINFYVLLYVIVIYIFVFIIGMFLLNRTRRTREVKATVLQSFVRPNMLLFGIALATNYYGTEMDISPLILLIGFLGPITNIFAVLGFEIYAMTGKISIFKIIINIFKNKLILAAIIGLVFKVSNIPFPIMIAKPLTDLANVTTPLGLLFIGGGLIIGKNEELSKNLFLSCIVRNFIVPLVGITIAILLRFTGMDLFAIVIAMSAPVAVSSYVMAVNYTGESQLASRIIMYTTLLSGITLFVIFYILSGNGLI